MAFNLKSLALKKDTFPLQLRNPVDDTPLADDEGNKVIINVYGTASKEYRDAVRAMQNRQLKRGNKKATAAEIQEEGVELLVAVSESAENLELDGQPVSSPASFRTLYSNPEYSWVREQVDAAVGDIGNFLSQ